jgi:hypothetical protein
MVIFIQENGFKIKLKDMVFIVMPVELFFKVTGNQINKRVMDNKYGQIMQYIKVNIKMVKNMEKVNLNGQIIHVTKDNSLTII